MISKSVCSLADMDQIRVGTEEILNKFFKDFLGIAEHKIKSLKFFSWLKMIGDPEIESEERLLAYYQLNRYSKSLDFCLKYKDNIKKETIKELFNGSSKKLGEKEEDFLFEIDMAHRIINSSNELLINKIDLQSKTDIIMENIFVECKKIHSEKSFEANLSKANKQLGNIDSPNAVGMVALDLINVIDRDEFLELSKPIIDRFIKNNKNLDMEEFHFILNPDFQKIIQALFAHFLNYKFEYLYRRKFKSFNWNKNIMAIFYQAETYIPIQNDEYFIPIRAATYQSINSERAIFLPYLNYPISRNNKESNMLIMRKFINDLAVGI